MRRVSGAGALRSLDGEVSLGVLESELDAAGGEVIHAEAEDVPGSVGDFDPLALGTTNHEHGGGSGSGVGSAAAVASYQLPLSMARASRWRYERRDCEQPRRRAASTWLQPLR